MEAEEPEIIARRIRAKHMKNRPELAGLSPDTKLCRGYTRVSTNKQVEGLSLPVQTRQIEEYCKKNNYKLLKIYTDEGISGKDFANRQGYKDLVKDLCFGETLIVPSLSRLGRNVGQYITEVEKLKEKGINMIFLDMPGLDVRDDSGDFMAKLLTLVAEQERKQISARTIIGMSGLNESGKIRTKPRFGWKVVNKELVEDEDEQDTIKYIASLIRKNPDITVASIVKAMNGERMTIRKSNKIYHETVKKIITDNNLR